MPTYVYHCTSCARTYEVDQRIIEPPLDTCTCGSHGTVKRVMQPIAVMFKGSGFHINDYAPPTAPPEKQEAKPEATSETPAGNATEAVKPSTDSTSTDSTVTPASKAPESKPTDP